MDEKEELKYLYHYTTVEGFKGIVESQEIWATSIYYLNDWREFYHGQDEIRSRIKRVLPDLKGYVRKAAESILEEFTVPRPKDRPDLFVCSFSAAAGGDDLSQWRAYCPSGGFSIGFPFAHLGSQGYKSNFYLWKCIYEIDPASSFEQAIAGWAKPDWGPRSRVPFECRWGVLWTFAALYKDPAFRAEQEWRLVHMPSELPSRFRACRNLLVPYTACRLNDPDLWRDAQIMVSPGPLDQKELRLESAKMFLESKLKDHKLPTACVQNVRSSDIPYRTNAS